MGNFKNEISTFSWGDISEFFKKIQVATTVPFNNEDKEILKQALMIIEIQIERRKISYDIIPDVVILINDGPTFTFSANNSFAFRLPLIVISFGEIVRNNLDDEAKTGIYLEEFIHHFFNIPNEKEAKEEVVSLINEFYQKNYSFYDIYPHNWEEDYI